MADPRMDLLHRLFAFWREALHLCDLALDVKIVSALDAPDALMQVSVASGGDDAHKAVIKVAEDLFKEPPEYISNTVCHELVHVLLWPLAEALTGFDSQLTSAQRAFIGDAMLKGDEAATYRLERILTSHIRVPRAVLTGDGKTREVKATLAHRAPRTAPSKVGFVLPRTED